MYRLHPGGTPQRIAALPANGLPNGLAIDPQERDLYITDSVLGTIWRVPVSGGTATAWDTSSTLAATSFLGANGIKVHDGQVWATNLDKGTVVRIPILRDGSHSIVLTLADGLENATSLILRDRTVYVFSAAYLTEKDPNMLEAHFDGR